MFLQGSGYANVPNSVITTRFSVMARTYASVRTNLENKGRRARRRRNIVFLGAGVKCDSSSCLKQNSRVGLDILLSIVGDLAVLKVKFVHEGLSIEEVIKGLISDLKQPRTQTEKTSFQKWRNPPCEANMHIDKTPKKNRCILSEDCSQTCDRCRKWLRQLLTCLKNLLVSTSWVFKPDR